MTWCSTAIRLLHPRGSGKASYVTLTIPTAGSPRTSSQIITQKVSNPSILRLSPFQYYLRSGKEGDPHPARSHQPPPLECPNLLLTR